MDYTSGTSDIEHWRLALAVGLLMVSAFCAHLLLLPGPHRRARLPLGLFFLSNALRLVALPVEHLTLSTPASLLHITLDLAEVPLSTVQPFLLWLYVRRLTEDPTRPHDPVKSGWHLTPVIFAIFVYLFVLTQQATLGVPSLDAYALALQGTTVALLWCVTLVFYALVPIYAVLTVRLLLSYKTRLKDLYASTEGRELRWIWCLTAAVAFFWAFNLASILAEAFGDFDWTTTGAGSFYFGAFAQIALLWIIAVWGIRQKPGMSPPRGPVTEDTEPVQDFKKYGRSGLDHARLARIAAKIEQTMARDKLYQNPDLSLWDLSEKIGAKRHYVSQALNDKIGHSFFDYVNTFRIDDAKRQLLSTESSILAITYDVGFNSRSVFYRAFKQEVGMTPSQFRQGASVENTAKPICNT
ncbi:AraC family transcriptional regulator [uncultured Roseobacter sp.]|uniref:helix-turn-helix transcriptional regulator n=1 Tax=uncultured Roseobacter sp. TaxID=114847 RepID=UPI002629CD66|nr:AraC family transcriptional regulator [uncultured Roseobacter sp.]